MTEVEIKEINAGSEAYEQLLHFRNKLLRIPLGLDLFNEDLSDDANDHIIIALQGDKIVGCVMLQPKDKHVIKLRQMATAEEMQRKGLGKLLMAHAEETATENGYTKVMLHARISAKEFYEKLGYTSFGEVFTEVTIPHIAMQKILQ
ncbi:MAG TPA: GNAT family N-acetyltransferase [Flavipsychrobacter sp.]|nr:GNAT family N-acetyltransferase [Flavipsychrobacter sp.]